MNEYEEKYIRDTVLVYNDDHVNLILCIIHNVFEVMGPETYRVCFECKHVYSTPADLEAAWTRTVREINQSAAEHNAPLISEHRSADEIYFCQECIHDF